jgi:hypothetical protein
LIDVSRQVSLLRKIHTRSGRPAYFLLRAILERFDIAVYALCGRTLEGVSGTRAGIVALKLGPSRFLEIRDFESTKIYIFEAVNDWSVFLLEAVLLYSFISSIDISFITPEMVCPVLNSMQYYRDLET